MSVNNILWVSSVIALVLISACSSEPISNPPENESVLTTSFDSQPTQALLINDFIVEHKNIRINHHKVECEGYWVDQCLLYKNDNDTDWHYLYEDIEGFEYQWGYEYELLVEVEKILSSNGPADQLTTVYRLSQILTQKHRADESFFYASRHPSTILTKQSDGVFSLLDGKKFSCGIDDCESIESAIAQQQGIALSLKHSTDASQPLALEAVLCSSSLVGFASDCGTGK